MNLKKITEDNIWDIVKLSVNDTQKNFVASNTESILEAYVTITNNGVALPFGLYEEDLLVGFVMLGYGTTGDESEPSVATGNYCLWRFMIDKNYQGQGLGKKAMEAILAYIKEWPCGEAEYCWLSYEPENLLAKHLYQSFGFCENGEKCGEEVVSVCKL